MLFVHGAKAQVEPITQASLLQPHLNHTTHLNVDSTLFLQQHYTICFGGSCCMCSEALRQPELIKSIVSDPTLHARKKG
jgi:hypothetical protein